MAVLGALAGRVEEKGVEKEKDEQRPVRRVAGTEQTGHQQEGKALGEGLPVNSRNDCALLLEDPFVPSPRG